MDDLHKLTQYFSAKGDVVLLESQSESHPSSQISYLAALPSAQIISKGNLITVMEGDSHKEWKANPWEALKTFRSDFGGWAFGYLGYDLKNHIEQLHSQNPDHVNAPDMYFMIPGFLLERNHRTGEQQVLLGNLPSEEKLKAVLSKEFDEFELGELQLQTNRNEYLRKIEQAQQCIAEGEFYEINLSHQMRTSFTGAPFGLYQKMRETGPVPFGSYLKLGNIHVCSQSPERFLRKDKDVVYSQPIKGTAQRGATAEEDLSLKAGLESSQKERAENLMIVDLVRNDLSRIAQKGTVEVSELFSIQSFDTVHQMVSTVKAKSMEDEPIEILKACFPMGSMTGAPKISVMKSIEVLEDYKRGIYSGAIGYITPEDDFDFNVVIRTAIIKNNDLFYCAGGAITGDSDPKKEWEETQIKARALLHVLERGKNG